MRRRSSSSAAGSRRRGSCPLLQFRAGGGGAEALPAEPGERAVLGAQRLVQGLALLLELRLRLGASSASASCGGGDAALEVPGVALMVWPRCPRKAEAVIALGAGAIFSPPSTMMVRAMSSEKIGVRARNQEERNRALTPWCGSSGSQRELAGLRGECGSRIGHARLDHLPGG